MVPPLDEAEEILSKDFEYHADVNPVRAFVLERIEESNDVFAAWMIRICLHDLFQQLDLVYGRFGVMCSRPDHFQSHMLSRSRIPRQPDGGKVTPPKLPHNDIFAVVVCLTH